MSEHNNALISRLYDEGINRHDAKAAAALYAADTIAEHATLATTSAC